MKEKNWEWSARPRRLESLACGGALLRAHGETYGIQSRWADMTLESLHGFLSSQPASVEGVHPGDIQRAGVKRIGLQCTESVMSNFLQKPQFPHPYSGANTCLARVLRELR